jgi:hypothetical protein
MGFREILSSRKSVMLLALAASVILYVAGVYTGLNANQVVKQETNQTIASLRAETEENMKYLQNYIDFLDKNVKSMQLEETFAETLTPAQMCNFSTISMNGLISQLSYYWERLPFRIEEYEKITPNPSEEYLVLKQEYTDLSIRTWILARKLYKTCNTNVIYGLYFYSTNCSNCVEQGEQIDRLNAMVKQKGADIIMFPIDFQSNNILIRNLKQFYSISSVPALIINDKVYQGRLFTAEELLPSSDKGPEWTKN